MQKITDEGFFRDRKAAELYAEFYPKMRGLEQEQEIAKIIERNKIPVVVDFGIGPGRELAWIEKIKCVKKIIGVDISKNMLSFCRRSKKLLILREDFTRPEKLKKILGKDRERTAFLMIGNTLAMFGKNRRRGVLSAVSKLMKPEDIFFACFWNRTPGFFSVRDYEKQPWIFRGVSLVESGRPEIIYNRKTGDIYAKGKYKYNITHKWTRKEIFSLFRKSGLKIKKLIRNPAMYIVAAERKHSYI